MTKVYVSSTFEDLQEHRRAVSVAIRRAGWEDVAMEYYVAEDKRSVDRCVADVASCDLYIGLFAWRYGWVPPKQKRSITELEFRTAVKTNKPRLLFLADPKVAWPPMLIDANRTKIESLRKTAGNDRMVGFFSTPDSLTAQLAPALQKQIEIKPATSTGIDIEAYFRYLRRRYGVLDLDALMDPKRDDLQPLRLQSIFIEQSVKEDPAPLELTKDMVELLENRGEVQKEDLPQGLSEEVLSELRRSYLSKPSQAALTALGDESARRSIVLGDPGAGKSTLLRYIILSLAEPAASTRPLPPSLAACLPILIDLKSYTALRGRNACRTFFEYLDTVNEPEGCPATGRMLREYLQEKKPAVILFDGIDEIFEQQEQEEITNQIIGISETFPHARLITTSRIIGYRRTLLTNAGFKHFTLHDLDRDAIVAFTRSWYGTTLSSPNEVESRVQRITSAYDTSPSIRQLAGNPMLLTIMAIIGKHQELPRARWNLYDHAASVLVQHWDVKKHLADKQLGADLMDDDDKKELLRRLAYAMQKGEGGLAGNYIHSQELHQIFDDYLRNRYHLSVEQSTKIARAMIAQFRERNFILAAYGANLYGFVHRGFLEFFCASAIVYRFEKTRDLPVQELKELFAEHHHEKAWHEVLCLTCGAIGESFAGEIIDHLRAFGDGQHLKLAIDCLSELRRIDAVPTSAESLLSATLDWLSLPVREDAELRQKVMYAAAAIGPRWPRREVVVSWVQKHLPSGMPLWWPAHVVGRVGSGISELRDTLLQHLASSSATADFIGYALAAGWSDHTVVIDRLIDRARNTHSFEPFVTLGYYCNNIPRVLTFLFEAANRGNRDAQDTVVNYLPADDRSVAILLNVASKPSAFRREAIEGLRHHLRRAKVRAGLQKLLNDEEHGAVAAEVLAGYVEPTKPAKKPTRRKASA